MLLSASTAVSTIAISVFEAFLFLCQYQMWIYQENIVDQNKMNTFNKKKVIR